MKHRGRQPEEQGLVPGEARFAGIATRSVKFCTIQIKDEIVPEDCAIKSDRPRTQQVAIEAEPCPDRWWIDLRNSGGFEQIEHGKGAHLPPACGRSGRFGKAERGGTEGQDGTIMPGGYPIAVARTRLKGSGGTRTDENQPGYHDEKGNETDSDPSVNAHP